MPQGDQVKNGKAFEYAIAKVYQEYISQQGRQAVLVENEACLQAKRNLTMPQRKRLTR